MQNDQQTRPLPAFVALESPYLRRTLLLIWVALAVVAAASVAVAGQVWSAVYFVSGAWATGFFTLTPLIIKHLIFDRQIGLGLIYMGLKMMMIVALIGLLLLWQRMGQGGALDASAVVAGLTTPLAVVFLRALGSARGGRASAANNISATPTAGSH